jgi:hypothetical protein
MPLRIPAPWRSPQGSRPRGVGLRGAFIWGASLALLGVGTKLSVVALSADARRIGSGGPSCWWSTLSQDLRLGAVFAGLVACAGLTHRLGVARGRARTVLWFAYLALALYTAANLPVMRHLSSPLTPALLHATGAALGDSLAHYLTWTNVAVPLALVAWAVMLPPLLGRLCQRVSSAEGWQGAWAFLALLAVGTLTLIVPESPRCPGVALRRSPVETFLRAWAVAHVSSPRELPSLSSPACQPREPQIPAATFRDEEQAFLRRAVGRNLVWIILESTRADVLKQTPSPMPAVSTLARDALVFEDASCAYPESIKGLYAALCGRAPPLGREASTLGTGAAPCQPVAAAIGRAGYRTGLFHSGWFAYLGMEAVVRERGFDVLVDARQIESRARTSFGVDDDATARRLLTWLDDESLGRAGRPPFFAVFMPIAGHHPYHAPSLRPRPQTETTDHEAYLQDLGIADAAVGLLRDGLVARGLDARTTYVVVGDHGEAFGEHPGNIAHALHVYEENVRVPFFIAAPGARAGPLVSPLVASTLDLAPTLMVLAGLTPPPDGYEGRSVFGGEPRVARFFTEQTSRRRGVRDGRWKLIWHVDEGRSELFDVRSDPAESNDLANQAPERAASYRACLAFE